MRAGVIGLQLISLFAPAILAAQGTSPSNLQLPSIRRTYDELQKVELDDPEGFPYTDVPEVARPLLTQLKHELRDLILATLNVPSGGGTDPAQLSARVTDTLKQEGIPIGKDDLPGLFGGIRRIKFDRPPTQPALVAVTTTLEIPCGSDTSLYIFRQAGAQWKLALAVEANNYPEINGAQEAFDYAISRPDAKGEWFVVTAHTHPWCTSCWNGLTHQVFRPGPNPDAPKLLVKESEGVYRCEDDIYKLRLVGDGFKINRIGAYGLDSVVFMGVYADRFSVKRNRVTRVAPVAYLPQDFLYRWVGFPWSEASSLTTRANRQNLQHWHGRLGGEERYKRYSSTLEFVQPCNPLDSKWVISLSIDSEKRAEKLPDRLFFTVIKEKEVFYLDRIDTTRPPGCPGEARPVDSWDTKLREQLMNR